MNMLSVTTQRHTNTHTHTHHLGAGPHDHVVGDNANVRVHGFEVAAQKHLAKRVD